MPQKANEIEQKTANLGPLQNKNTPFNQMEWMPTTFVAVALRTQLFSSIFQFLNGNGSRLRRAVAQSNQAQPAQQPQPTYIYLYSLNPATQPTYSP